MNATQLFHEDGRPAGLWYCGTCRMPFRDQEVAEQHCRCRECGESCPRDSPGDYTHLHRTCFEKRNAQRIAERIEKAVEVDGYDGPVYVDGRGPQDGYFANAGEAEEWIWDTHEDGDELPQWAFCCHVESPSWPDVEDVFDRLADNMYEGFEDHLNGTEELSAAFDAFREANKDMKVWNVDYSRKVRLNWEGFQ